MTENKIDRNHSDLLLPGEEIAKILYQANNKKISLDVYNNSGDPKNDGRLFLTDTYVLIFMGNDRVTEFLEKFNSYKRYKYDLKVGYTVWPDGKWENSPTLDKLIKPFSEDRLIKAKRTDFSYKDATLIIGENKFAGVYAPYLDIFKGVDIYLPRFNTFRSPVEIWKDRNVMIGLIMPLYNRSLPEEILQLEGIFSTS